MKPMYIGLMAGCVLLSSCGGRLAMVGLDKSGKATEAFLNESKYTEHMTEALITIEESVLPELAKTRDGGEWKLRTAVVGFGVKAETGIGPFKVAFKPRMRAAFANGTKPPIP
jgi:hypothetical protein